MLKAMPDTLRGVISIILIALNTVVCSILLYAVALLRLPSKNQAWRNACNRLANAIAQSWVGFNRLGLAVTKELRWDVQGTENLNPRAWYLLVSNHQSMVDIAVLQNVLHRKTPPLKFFLKQELIYVPVIGLAWWVLDFPFMKRSTSARRDMETARRACEKFKSLPVTVTNFVEGTRFTEPKRQKSGSPYQHLLEPKVGGMAVALSTLGEKIDSVLDVTIVYPGGVPELWKFLCGYSFEIKVRVKKIPLDGDVRGDYFADKAFRPRFKNWLFSLWSEKDALIAELNRRS